MQLCVPWHEIHHGKTSLSVKLITQYLRTSYAFKGLNHHMLSWASFKWFRKVFSLTSSRDFSHTYCAWKLCAPLNSAFQRAEPIVKATENRAKRPSNLGIWFLARSLVLSLLSKLVLALLGREFLI